MGMASTASFPLIFCLFVLLVIQACCAIPADDQDDWEEFSQQDDFTSTTGCNFRINSSELDCEYSVFSLPTRASAKIKVAKSNSEGGDLLCSPVQDKDFYDKVLVVERGICPFTEKALNAQNAGAAALVIGHNVEGQPPVRMKSKFIAEYAGSFEEEEEVQIMLFGYHLSQTSNRRCAPLLPQAAAPRLL